MEDPKALADRVVRDQARGLIYALKNQRSQNADYLFDEVRTALKA